MIVDESSKADVMKFLTSYIPEPTVQERITALREMFASQRKRVASLGERITIQGEMSASLGEKIASQGEKIASLDEMLWKVCHVGVSFSFCIHQS